MDGGGEGAGEGDLDDEIQRHLLPGELVLWSGRPRQGLWTTWFDAPLMAVGLLVSAVSVGALAAGYLLALPAGVVGLYLLLGQFFVDARVRAGMAYVITDRRSLVVRTWPRPAVAAVDLRLITRCTVEWVDGQMATIDLAAAPGRFRWIGPARPFSPVLRGVVDPAELLPIIRGELSLEASDRGLAPDGRRVGPGADPDERRR